MGKKYITCLGALFNLTKKIMADVTATTNFEGIILNKIKQPHAKKKKKSTVKS